MDAALDIALGLPAAPRPRGGGGRAWGHGAAVELESVYCLGQCALSPALMINGTLHAKITPHKFDALFAAASKQVEVTA